MLTNKSRIYLDYAASTPVAPEVFEAMKPYFSEEFGNAGSVHSFGQKAQAALDKAREVLAHELGAKFNEVIFTASATEANNSLLRGAVAFAKASANRGTGKPRIIVSKIEHESVLETARELEKDGVEVVYLPVSREGLVDPEGVRKNLNENTILVSIIYASNEIGTIQPIHEIGKIINEFREEKRVEGREVFLPYPLFHTDAAQAFQFIKLDINKLGVDALTISGQKIYGPKGAAALFIKNEVRLLVSPLITGGLQESGFRSGTENIPAIVGFAKAAELITENREVEAGRIKNLRDYFWEELRKTKPEIQMNGSFEERLPNSLNVYFPGEDGESLLIKLDEVGVAASIGSACSVKAFKPSYVIEALGLEPNRAKSSIRFTLGRPTTKEEIDTALSGIKLKLK